MTMPTCKVVVDIISDFVFSIFIALIGVIVAFIIKLNRDGKARLLQRLYFVVAVLFINWLFALIGVKFTNLDNTKMLYVLDAIMYISGSFLPVISLFMVFAYTKGMEKLPKTYAFFFIIPALTNIMVWTNPLHHLFYRVFSIIGTEVVFGPFLYINALYSVIVMVLSVAIMLSFAFTSRSTLHIKQTVLFLIGSITPLLFNIATMLRLIEPSIVTTPLSFISTIVCHGYVIYKLHFFDIRPIAMQEVLNLISDSYLVTNEKGLVVTFNTQFRDIFGGQHGIEENKLLSDCLKNDDVESKTGIYNLLTSIESSGKTETSIYYEQAVNVIEDGELVKRYYMVEIKPLIIDNRLSGFIGIFKDVTKVKESMQRLQSSQVRMMERERLASLGQMMGGMAHNLKTPIMSISGGATAVENLVEECIVSLGDKEVTEADYREIYGEMKEWLQRVRVACTYMSDIISAVKGQATNMNVSDDTDFSISETLKRVSLLLRHELVNSNCRIRTKSSFDGEILLHGDINNMVQVVNNLISNAIYAMEPKGGGTIEIVTETDDSNLRILVIDRGVGVPPEVKRRLFKQMITSKGALGTGLGLYMSNVVIRGKFDGEMWVDDNPGGGAVFGISIPKENVKFIPKRPVEVI